MRFVSLDTAASEPHNRSIERLMQERPTPTYERTVIRTKAGNLVTPKAR
jgi:hypothetical protein